MTHISGRQVALSVAIAAALGTARPHAALAQVAVDPANSKPPSEVSSPDPSSILQEVVVSARRRDEDIQTVPLSITALSSEQLKENNIQSPTDLQFLTPSLSFESTVR